MPSIFLLFFMSLNFFLIRCAKIFSSIFRGARKTLKNCANYTNFTNLVMVCEEWGEEKNVVRMRSSLPWPLRFEVTFLNVFSMRNEVRTSTRSKRGQMSGPYWLHYLNVYSVFYLWLSKRSFSKENLNQGIASEPDFLFIPRPEFYINLLSTNQIRVNKKPESRWTGKNTC